MEAGKIKKTAGKALEKTTRDFNLFVNSLFGKIPKSENDQVARAALVNIASMP